MDPKQGIQKSLLGVTLACCLLSWEANPSSSSRRRQFFFGVPGQTSSFGFRSGVDTLRRGLDRFPFEVVRGGVIRCIARRIARDRLLVIVYWLPYACGRLQNFLVALFFAPIFAVTCTGPPVDTPLHSSSAGTRVHTQCAENCTSLCAQKSL